ncbi:hypothetical protein [Shewanella sairae]|nr:hypothetical protein [Shewanella sairae]
MIDAVIGIVIYAVVDSLAVVIDIAVDDGLKPNLHKHDRASV